MDIPPQSLFFFKGKWSADLDDQLIATLVRMKEELRHEEPGIPDEALVVARAKVEGISSIKLTIEELKDRVKFLATRLDTFQAVVTTPGVFWYPNLKVVDAVDSLWVEMMKGHPLAAAYYHEDEPEYRRLTTLFGLLDVKQESSSEWKAGVGKEVIVLSDTTVPRRDVVDLMASDSPFSQEVNSPVTVLGEKVKRKLFDDTVEPSDRESSNKPPTIHGVTCPQGKPITKTTLARRMPVHFRVPSPKSSPGGSSQASNSPIPRVDINRP